MNLSTAEEAQTSIKALNGAELQDGKAPLFVVLASKKKEHSAKKRKQQRRRRMRQARPAGVNLYVKNLPESILNDQLRELFEPYGTITSAVVQLDNNNRTKGFGFVCFSTPEEATKAVTALNGKVLEDKPLYVALAQSKKVRHTHLNAIHASQNMARRHGGPWQGHMPFYAPHRRVPPPMYPGNVGMGFIPGVCPVMPPGHDFPGGHMQGWNVRPVHQGYGRGMPVYQGVPTHY